MASQWTRVSPASETRRHPRGDSLRVNPRRWAAAVVLTALVALRAWPASPTAPDPFAFFQPSVTVSVDERRRLDEGQALARVLPGQHHQIAIFAAVPVDVDGDRLVAWVRDIAGLKRSSAVLAIGRFSDPPRLEDLAALTLDDADLSSIRDCRPGRCGLKLQDSEIAQLQTAIADRGDWKPVLQDAFRRLVLRRVQAYRASGIAGEAQPPLSSIFSESPFLARVPGLVEYLNRYPRVPMPEGESFIYWSKEQLGAKPVVSATHVCVVRGGRDAALPDVLVAGRQIFATHYMDGALALTVLLRNPAGSHNYLTYLNRSQVDSLGGFSGAMVRWFVERRSRTEAARVLQGLRRRLESGEPGAVRGR
jgi:hypothetical protein